MSDPEVDTAVQMPAHGSDGYLGAKDLGSLQREIGELMIDQAGPEGASKMLRDARGDA